MTVESRPDRTRVISLVPSATETLVAWGVTPVGVTRFCPPCGAPTVGGTKDPDLSAIDALAPDLVVVCEEENRRPDAEALRAAGHRLQVLRIDDVADVDPQLAALAGAVGHEGPVTDGPLPPPTPASGRTVVSPIWRRPWMVLGARCYGAGVLRHLGLDPLELGDDRYPTVELATLIDADAGMVVAPDEPYPFVERHRAELEQIAPVRFVDGADLLWWGWRTPAALRRLAVALG